MNEVISGAHHDDSLEETGGGTKDFSQIALTII